MIMKKTVRINISMQAEELADITKKAKKAKMTRSKYIVRQCLNNDGKLNK